MILYREGQSPWTPEVPLERLTHLKEEWNVSKCPSLDDDDDDDDEDDDDDDDDDTAAEERTFSTNVFFTTGFSNDNYWFEYGKNLVLTINFIKLKA
jgi:hypothetical protein